MIPENVKQALIKRNSSFSEEIREKATQGDLARLQRFYVAVRSEVAMQRGEINTADSTSDPLGFLFRDEEGVDLSNVYMQAERYSGLSRYVVYELEGLYQSESGKDADV